METTTTAVHFDRIISDNGSGFVKLGYAGDNYPRFCFPAIYGTPVLRSGALQSKHEITDPMIGDEANECREFLELSHPLIEG